MVRHPLTAAAAVASPVSATGVSGFPPAADVARSPGPDPAARSAARSGNAANYESPSRRRTAHDYES